MTLDEVADFASRSRTITLGRGSGSRPEDVDAPRRAAPHARIVIIAGAGPFVFFNPHDKGRTQLVEALLDFVTIDR